jgi:hypothetical protein
MGRSLRHASEWDPQALETASLISSSMSAVNETFA